MPAPQFEISKKYVETQLIATKNGKNQYVFWHGPLCSDPASIAVPVTAAGLKAAGCTAVAYFEAMTGYNVTISFQPPQNGDKYQVVQTFQRYYGALGANGKFVVDLYRTGNCRTMARTTGPCGRIPRVTAPPWA